MKNLKRTKRECYIQDHVCHIPLNDGQEALCDEDRFAEVNCWSWYINRGYVRGVIKGKQTYIHNFLYPELRQIDHINNDKLDNRSCNLRECTCSENAMNRKVKTNKTSGYKGVYWHKSKNKWMAQLMLQYKKYYLGSFSDPKEAALAYNKKAIELFGEFAKLNVIEP